MARRGQMAHGLARRCHRGPPAVVGRPGGLAAPVPAGPPARPGRTLPAAGRPALAAGPAGHRRRAEPGPPCSTSSWRQRPQGASGRPSPAVTLTATSRAWPAGDQSGHETALRAQGEAEGSVFDVATGHDLAVVTQAGGTDPQAGVGGVGPGGDSVGRFAQRRPVRVRTGDAPCAWVPSGGHAVDITLPGAWTSPSGAPWSSSSGTSSSTLSCARSARSTGAATPPPASP